MDNLNSDPLKKTMLSLQQKDMYQPSVFLYMDYFIKKSFMQFSKTHLKKTYKYRYIHLFILSPLKRIIGTTLAPKPKCNCFFVPYLSRNVTLRTQMHTYHNTLSCGYIQCPHGTSHTRWYNFHRRYRCHILEQKTNTWRFQKLSN